MCLIAFQYNVHSDYPLIFVENRDEEYTRPSDSLHQWSDNPNVYGGMDLNHGGAWLGLTTNKRFAALTNHPFSGHETINDPHSRGKLVRDYLTSNISPRNFLQQLRHSRLQYNSYHLLFGTLDGLHLYNNAWNHHQTIKKGLHVISNTDDDLSHFKMKRAEKHVENYLNNIMNPTLDDLITLFHDSKQPEDVEDIPEDISKDLAKQNAAMFIKGDIFGTVNTTAILVHRSGQVTMKEVRYNQEHATTDITETFSLE